MLYISLGLGFQPASLTTIWPLQISGGPQFDPDAPKPEFDSTEFVLEDVLHQNPKFDPCWLSPLLDSLTGWVQIQVTRSISNSDSGCQLLFPPHGEKVMLASCRPGIECWHMRRRRREKLRFRLWNPNQVQTLAHMSVARIHPFDSPTLSYPRMWTVSIPFPILFLC